MLAAPLLVDWLLAIQGIADVVDTLLDDVDSYLDEASGRGANQQVLSHKLKSTRYFWWWYSFVCYESSYRSMCSAVEQDSKQKP